MLNTCPTKAGPPPPFPLALPSRTDFAAGRAGSAAESREAAESGGPKKRGRETEEGGCGSVIGDEGFGFGGLRREAKLEAVDWMKVDMWLRLRLWLWRGSDGRAMQRTAMEESV